MKQCPRGLDPGMTPLTLLISRKQVKFLAGWRTAQEASRVGKTCENELPSPATCRYGGRGSRVNGPGMGGHA